MNANTSRMIRAIDTLAEAERLVEASFMACHALSRAECGAMQTVIEEAANKIEKCKADFYAILEGNEGDVS